jgi:carbon-monoxide dehydrogenase small subunit
MTDPDPTGGEVEYSLCINGSMHQVRTWIGESLLFVLREKLGYWGAKNACEQGECGSCSVLIDGRLCCSCLELAAAAQGTDITTIEGLGSSGDMGDIQRAFVVEGAVQCGFCTPGMVVACHALLKHNATPSSAEIREALAGNLCRCTGYGRIEAAIKSVVEARNE